MCLVVVAAVWVYAFFSSRSLLLINFVMSPLSRGVASPILFLLHCFCSVCLSLSVPPPPSPHPTLSLSLMLPDSAVLVPVCLCVSFC